MSLPAPFAFTTPTRVSFGAGVRHDVPGLIERHGWQKVGLVVDPGLRGVDAVDALVRATEAVAGTLVAWCEPGEPTYDSLEALRPPFADFGPAAVIGIGGGSALDTAKGMAALVHNRGPAIGYRGFDKLTAPVLPIVTVPTTAGTGSEVTPNASFVDTRERRKMGINGEAVRPAFAFLDPELTVSCPAGPTVSAAADSLVHATEAYVARRTNPMARLLAREGFQRVFEHLGRVVMTRDDLEARSEVMLGAFLAGLALMHSGTGPAAAMSYPLGVLHGVPHGIAGALFLPVVAAHNAAHGVSDYADFYVTMPAADLGRPRAWQAAAFADRIRELWTQVGLPLRLSSVGVNGEAIPALVSGTLGLQAALDQNPIPFGEPEVTAALQALATG